MNKAVKFAALALASVLAISVAPMAANAAPCTTKAKVTMLGTIKPEIRDEFLAAVKDYNNSQKCYTVKTIAGAKGLSFLQTVTPMYAAHRAPTIMYGLQDIPNMANKVIDWKGTKLAKLVPSGLLASAMVGKQLAGVPSTAEGFGLLYNKTVLDKAGVDPSKIKTRTDLEAAFKKVEASGTGAIRFSGIWWSLGAHVTNLYFTNAAKTHEGRLKVLDAMANGTKDLASDPVFKNWLDTFDLMNKYNQLKTPNVASADIEYKAAMTDLAAGKAGFWFMGNWAEPDLMLQAKGTDFGIMPLPISTDAKAYGNDSISVGVPGYFMVDKKQSTPAQRAGAIDFLTWLYTSTKGQHHVADPSTKKGMGFIPVYKGFKVQASTFMAKQIASYVKANKVLDWMNSYYPAGGQEKYGASAQKLITGTINGTQFAKELQDAWKGSAKTWRGEKVN